jgi:hypothetical protein
MNTALPIWKPSKPVVRPVSKWDALERFAAAMQAIPGYRQDMADEADYIREFPDDTEGEVGFWEKRLAESIGSATIAFHQLPADLQALLRSDFEQAVKL